jgi:hypothetical protein
MLGYLAESKKSINCAGDSSFTKAIIASATCVIVFGIKNSQIVNFHYWRITFKKQSDCVEIPRLSKLCPKL